MKLNAVAVSAKDVMKSVEFYRLLGFEFGACKKDDQHVESVKGDGEAKLMIDSAELMKSLIGEEPRPGNHSSFAVEFGSASEVNEVAKQVADAGFKVVKEPWDAFWGQRYAVVEDPDGYKVDLYAGL